MPSCASPRCTAPVETKGLALCSIHSKVPPATLSPRRPGQSARERADAVASKQPRKMLISKLTFGFIKAPNYSWRVGADAEEAVGRELEKLPPGWFVRHDIFIGKRWNVDHIIVGPPGVFLFDTKFRSGIVKTTRDGIRVNNRRTDMAEKVQDQAREASGQFRDAGLRTWVQPVLVFDNDIRGTRQPDGVHVVGLARVIEYLKALPPGLEDAEVQRLGRVLLDDATWPFTPQSDDDAVFYEVPKQRWKWAALATAGAALGALLIGAATLRGPTAPPSPPPESIEAISARYRAVATRSGLDSVLGGLGLFVGLPVQDVHLGVLLMPILELHRHTDGASTWDHKRGEGEVQRRGVVRVLPIDWVGRWLSLKPRDVDGDNDFFLLADALWAQADDHHERTENRWEGPLDDHRGPVGADVQVLVVRFLADLIAKEEVPNSSFSRHNEISKLVVVP